MHEASIGAGDIGGNLKHGMQHTSPNLTRISACELKGLFKHATNSCAPDPLHDA